MLTLWHIGNTTVRTPYRLKEALHVLKNSEYHGNLVGKEREEGFARLLNQQAVVRVERIEQGSKDDFSDLGRKWRSALAQLGFVVKHITSGLKQPIDPRMEPFVKDFLGLSARPYEITPNGYRLIQASSVAEQQECFLRALAAYKIPSIFEPRYKCSPFSPLRFVLQISLLLKKKGKEPRIKFEEMALIVQRRSPDDGIDNVVSQILSFREKRNKAENKKKFDKETFVAAVGGKHEKANTLKDYSDLNFRYLKATGLFQSKGRAIALIPEKYTLIDFLVSEPESSYNEYTYLKNLWSGAKLPTDDKMKAINIINNLLNQLKGYGEEYLLGNLNEQSLDELSHHRYQLEERLRCQKERAFAEEQANRWQEIINFMEAFRSSKRKVILPTDEMVTFPRGEAPAYFEWIIWRAFLAIDSLENMPWEARKFKIDQDFLPLSHAPAGGPDMVFEFEEYVLVVEVTLTSSSRQEAAEGEPVRRHVAEIAEHFEKMDKEVYCLFIALNIDSNTAETFKIGNWYKKDDTKIPVQIVPMILDDFIRLFNAGFKSGHLDPMKLKQLLMKCRVISNRDAPEWKTAISDEIKKFVLKL